MKARITVEFMLDDYNNGDYNPLLAAATLSEIGTQLEYWGFSLPVFNTGNGQMNLTSTALKVEQMARVI